MADLLECLIQINALRDTLRFSLDEHEDGPGQAESAPKRSISAKNSR